MVRLRKSSDGGPVERLAGSGALFTIMAVFAAVLGVVVIVALVMSIVTVSPHVMADLRGTCIVIMAVLALCGLGVSAIIFLLALRLRLRASQQRSVSTAQRQDTGTAAAVQFDGQAIIAHLTELNHTMLQAMDVLKNINENTLLDDTSKRSKFDLHSKQQRQLIFADVDKFIRIRNWARAKALLESLEFKYPGNEDISHYVDKLIELRNRALGDDVDRAKRKIDDLMAISAWDRATAEAESLLEQHGDADVVKEMVEHVSELRAKFREEQLNRLSGEVEKCITRKRWNDALQTAKQLVEKYPDSVEADGIYKQMPTLEANADIEKRQQLEEQIRDLVKQRNFVQAVELSKHVISTYPESPQAEALREQIGRFQELATQQEEEMHL